MRILFFVLSIAFLASSARSAIGPEHRLAALFPDMAGMVFDGDFVVALVQRGAADQRGLYVQWIKTNGALAASPIRLTTTEPDRVQIIGNPAETAVFWRGCDTGRSRSAISPTRPAGRTNPIAHATPPRR